MKQFFTLLKKEIRELITVKTLLPLVAMAIIFSSMGQLLGSEKAKIEQPWKLALLDESRSEISTELVEAFSQHQIEVVPVAEEDPDRAAQWAKENEALALLFIPENFEEEFEAGARAPLRLYRFINGFSIFSGASNARLDVLLETTRQFLRDQKFARSAPPLRSEEFLNPIALEEFTVAQDRQSKIEASRVTAFVQAQTMFVPIVLFMVIVFAAQMVASAIASEKENKTLEILLSSPVSRRTLVFSKILGAGLVGLLFSGIYMAGWYSYIGNLTGPAGVPTDPDFTEALRTLGLMVEPLGYVLLGISLFLSILCALAIAIILGLLAEDVKSVAAVTTPLMILILIPYFLTLFLDIASAAPLLRWIVYAIPFSHTFLAMQNAITHRYDAILYGLLYQAVIAGGFIVMASKIFTSDRILTLKLRFKKSY